MFVCTEEYRAELASAKKKHAVIDELTMRRLSAELFGSDAVMVSPCFAVAATACAMFKRVEVLGVSLTDDELSILNAVFGNIDRIESVHPELTRSGHGVFNGFYRDKTVVPDVLRKLGITRVQDILSINRHAKISNKCIIVGGSESVKTGSFGEYVDSCDRTVIRINTVFAPDGYERFVGRRTDLVIASSYHLGHDVINKDGRDKDISVYLTNEIRQKMKSGKSPLTTGFMAFLLCLYVFDDIELLGFGQSGDISPAGTCESYHNAGNKTQTGCRHDINFEHRFIDKLVADPEFNVSRVEESHAELLFQSSK